MVFTLLKGYIRARLLRLHALTASIIFLSDSNCGTMQQLAYDLLGLIPPLLLHILIAVYYVLCFASFFCAMSWIHHLNQALIRISFELNFKDGDVPELQQDALRRIDSPWRLKRQHCNLSKALIRLSHVAYSTLPLMLFVMTATVFWQKYLIYRIDLTCDPSDVALECFGQYNASGPLTCKAVHELGYKFFNCYKLAFDLQTASATAGGVFTTSVVINSLLAKFFIAVRHTVAGYRGTILLQAVGAVVTIVGFAMFVLYEMTSNPINNAEIFLRAYAISYRIFFLCLFPWFRAIPKEASDTPLLKSSDHSGVSTDGTGDITNHTENNYEWIPAFLQSEK